MLPSDASEVHSGSPGENVITCVTSQLRVAGRPSRRCERRFHARRSFCHTSSIRSDIRHFASAQHKQSPNTLIKSEINHQHRNTRLVSSSFGSRARRRTDSQTTRLPRHNRGRVAGGSTVNKHRAAAASASASRLLCSATTRLCSLLPLQHHDYYTIQQHPLSLLLLPPAASTYLPRPPVGNWCFCSAAAHSIRRASN